MEQTLEQANLSEEDSVWVSKAWSKPKMIPSPRKRPHEDWWDLIYLIHPLSNPSSI